MSIIKKPEVRVAQKVLRRLVARTVHLARLYESNTAVRTVAVHAVPAAETFQQAHDACTAAAHKRRACTQALREHGEGLGVMLSTWIPIFALEYGADASKLRPATDVVDDILAATKRLVSLVEMQRGTEPAHPGLDELKAQVALVEGLSADARVAAAEMQSLAQVSRDRAKEFQKALVVFRRVLANVAGQRSADYQMLRYRRARQIDEGAEVIVDAVTETQGATPTGTSEPVLGLGEVAAE